MPEGKGIAIGVAGTQRLISVTIGVFFALALIITVTFLFGTTQPHRNIDTATVSD